MNSVQQLRLGKTLEICGFQVRMIEGPIGPLNTYVAEGTNGPDILTADTINFEEGYIFSFEGVPPYRRDECVRVEIVGEVETESA